MKNISLSTYLIAIILSFNCLTAEAGRIKGEWEYINEQRKQSTHFNQKQEYKQKLVMDEKSSHRFSKANYNAAKIISIILLASIIIPEVNAGSCYCYTGKNQRGISAYVGETRNFWNCRDYCIGRGYGSCEYEE